VSESVTRNELNALQIAILHQSANTCQQGTVPGGVVTYCFSGNPKYSCLLNRKWS